MGDIQKFIHHIFVCTNERKEGHPRGSCSQRNSEAVLKAFKKELIVQKLKGDARAQSAGCLDACEQGVVVVVYPENVWYGKVTPEDVPEIVESHFKQGRPVKRLLIPGK
jgi:(2Fe-2S) ferredoxin